MKRTALPTIPRVADVNVQRAISALETALTIIGKTYVSNDPLLTVSVSSSATRFFHSLGVQPKGFILVDSQQDVRVWRTAWDAQSITLEASATATVTILLF